MWRSNELLRLNRKNGALLPQVFGVIEGGRMLRAEFSDKDLQNAYYAGYTGNVEVTYIFMFNFYCNTREISLYEPPRSVTVKSRCP